MPATINGGGDQLARGAVRATWGPNVVSQQKWDDIFGTDSGPKPNYKSAEDVAASGKRRPRNKRKK
jgi:hypothetical protein